MWHWSSCYALRFSCWRPCTLGAACSQAAVLAQPLSAALAAALPHWTAQQPLQEPVALAAAAGGAPGTQAYLQRRGAGVLYGCAPQIASLCCSH